MLSCYCTTVCITLDRLASLIRFMRASGANLQGWRVQSTIIQSSISRTCHLLQTFHRDRTYNHDDGRPQAASCDAAVP